MKLWKRAVLSVAEPGELPYSYMQMKADLKKLKKEFPNNMRIEVLGRTADNRGILEISLGDMDAKYHILIQAAIHGREYLNTVLVMSQIENYLRNQDNEVYNNICFHVIPMANPDGVTISQAGLDGIKNQELRDGVLSCYKQDFADGRAGMEQAEYFRRWKANARGVDLNRNFDCGWQDYGGTVHPSSEGFKGEAPASEVETKAILSLTDIYRIDCCIAYHSSGNLIYWDFGSEGEVYRKDKKLAECVSEVTGYPMISTISDAADSAGCSDCFVLKKGIPAITIETGIGSCPLRQEESPLIYRQNREVWRKTAEFCSST